MAEEEKTKDAEAKDVEESGTDAEKAGEKVEEAAEVTEEKSEEDQVPEAKEEVKEEKAFEEKAPEVTEAKKEIPAPSGKFKDLIKEIENLSVLELSELVKALEERFGVSASMAVAAPTSGVQGASTDSAGEEEKSSYDVILASSGDKKIQVIKAVREIKPDLGLKEAKDLVDGAPKEVIKGAKKEDAESAKAKLEAAGATVELK